MTDLTDTMLINKNGKLIPIYCDCGCNGINQFGDPNGHSDDLVTSEEFVNQIEEPLYEINSDGFYQWIPRDEEGDED